MAAVGGSVIGLGNIWRFPYIAGENGGAAFILIYLTTSFLISIPIMLSEFSIGRATRRNSKRAFGKLTSNKRWSLVGMMGILTAFIILSFYCVVGGWAFKFLEEALSNQFAGQSSDALSAAFNGYVASGWRPITWTVVFIVASSMILRWGVHRGIERTNKILMPLLFVLLVLLAINSLTLPGIREGVSFLLKPDFSKISGATVLQAMGQSFFSMSLGMGAMITYGSYMRKQENMMKVAATVALSDITIAILSGIAIFPAVFSFGINPSAGPELVFLTLPNVFARMAGGYFLAIIFFSLLCMAAITSSISLFEVVVAYLSEEMRMSRNVAISVMTGVVILTSSLCAMSMIPDSALVVQNQSLFDLFDNLSSNILLPLGGLLIVIFAGWVYAPERLRSEMTSEGVFGTRIYPMIRLLIRYVVPVVIALLFLSLTGIIKL